jgi:predicted alpha/beta hydrolase family esterase
MIHEKPKIYLVPRWAGNIHSDWYDSIFELIKNKYNITIERLEMPNWNEPNIEESIEYLSNQVKELNNQSYFIGHSVGCQAIIRFLIKQFEKNCDLRIGGCLFVAGWFEVDNPWNTLKPWIDLKDIDFKLISKKLNFNKLVLSDNDPFTTNYLKNKRLWEEKINSEVEIYPDRKHFNESEELYVFNEIERMILGAKKFSTNKQ